MKVKADLNLINTLSKPSNATIEHLIQRSLQDNRQLQDKVDEQGRATELALANRQNLLTSALLNPE